MEKTYKMCRKGEEDFYWLETARSYIDNSRRLLDHYGYVSSALGEMNTAINWAIQAWLINHGRADCVYSWESMRNQFYKIAPEDLKNTVSYCQAKVVFLGYELEGGFNHQEPIPPIQEAKERARTLLTKVEQTVALIEQDFRRPSSKGNK